MNVARLLGILLVIIGSYGSVPAQKSFEPQLILADSFGKIEKFDSCQAILDRVLLRYSQSSTIDQNNKRQQYLNALELKCYYYGVAELNVESARVGLQLIKLANKYNKPSIATSANLAIALVYEKMQDFTNCLNHLNEAKRLITLNGLEELNAYYYVRLSSYLRYIRQFDESHIQAEKAVKYAIKFNQPKHAADAHFLMSAYSKNNPLLSIKYLHSAAQEYKAIGQNISTAYMFSNISSFYFKLKQLDISLAYSDSSLLLFSQTSVPIPSSILFDRSKLLKAMGHLDSAFSCLKQASDIFASEKVKEQEIKIAQLTLENKLGKAQQIILQKINNHKIERQRLIWVSIALIVISVVLLMFFFTNKRIKSQNQFIREKSAQLEESLAQKESFLHEIHHRLKNNLQMVVSLLDLQKNSNSGKSQNELIDESKSRVLSMSYLHSHLYENTDFSNIHIEKYFENIVLLFKYSNQNKMVKYVVEAPILKLNIDKSLPLGLIVVELLSNGIKYAFNDTSSPLITLTLSESITNKYQYRLRYSDNGVGMPQEAISHNGIGLKLIDGFVKQLKGVLTFEHNQGLVVQIDFN